MKSPFPLIKISVLSFVLISMASPGAFAQVVANGAPIQAAIDAANPGDTVQLSPGGLYGDQIIKIDKNLILDGQNATLTSPMTIDGHTLITNGRRRKPIIWAEGANVVVKNLVIDGLNRAGSVSTGSPGFPGGDQMGIAYHNAGGRIEGVTVQNVQVSSSSLGSNGVGIYAIQDDGTSSLEIINNNVSTYQKNGITVSGRGLSVLIQGNTIQGRGLVSQDGGNGTSQGPAQNGIQLGFGAGGQILNNQISGNFYCRDSSQCPADVAAQIPASSADPTAAGILAYSPEDLTITGNTLTDNQMQISSLGAKSAVVTDNRIERGYVGINLGDADFFTNFFGFGETATAGQIEHNDMSEVTYAFFFDDWQEAFFNGGSGVVGPALNLTTKFNRIRSVNQCGLMNENNGNLVQNNWWGLNDPSGEQTNCPGTSASLGKALQLKLEALGTSFEVGQAIPLRIFVIDNDAGEDTSSLGNLTDSTLADITLSVSPGSFTSDGFSVSRGVRLESIRLQEPGTTKISATLDQQTVSIEIPVVTTQGQENPPVDQFIQGSGCQLQVKRDNSPTYWQIQTTTLGRYLSL
ncbi:MAG TPA: hypothetical protein DF383_06125 [Deltaproteobacteria bacterium]|nr:hypothetical protein [Deltaproteobacteria bacterium]